ncbi:ABC transporter permease [Pasteurella skyensis]|uniref:ABC transporter permease n=1 Tax=Phocoenobacter skyensis TaxID=97481 RepID=A0AAJ6N8L3_9PAST|nr:ABC transporter permease [Pasteurella skyensis]MDP8162041.1 ABC transporter permease [Pasteurella skyensis]MDP8172197.1 ABC transporter permease [Pasteurella skyensis]MDP8178343.1 ABC transporter permease [Pasteurella skyensis]MDP8182901.1 ABC transporter permease [Pasteurella skyensis]MDP8188759.1 ABC transporter permease [Pasteurella skyensis]
MLSLWRIFVRSAVWEWRIIQRHRVERVLLVLLPALTIGLIWYTFSASQVRNLPIGVIDKENTTLSRKLISMVNASPNVAVVKHFRDAQEMQHALRETQVYASIIIPENFSHRIHQLQPSPVTLVVNAQYGTHSGIIQSGVGSAVRTFSAGIELRLRTKMGMTKQQALDALIPIKPNVKMAFNQSLNYQQFLASTVIPALLHILATVVGVGVIGRELRHSTLGWWFAGVSKYDSEQVPRVLALFVALMGKLFWHSLIFCGWMTISIVLVTWHNSPPLANLCITILNGWLLMIISLWLGIVLTAMAMSNRMGLSNAGIITAPAFAFSGVTYPLVAMPKAAQIIATMLPLTHYLQSQIAQIQTQQSWHLGLSTSYNFIIALIILMILGTLFTTIALKRKHRWGMR